MSEKIEMTKEEFENKCYAAYQLDWMISHGYSIDDFYNAIRASVVDQVAEGYDMDDSRSAENAMQCAIEEFHDAGFGGTLWACKDEFLSTEYLNLGYMFSLFEHMQDTETMKSLYMQYTP